MLFLVQPNKFENIFNVGENIFIGQDLVEMQLCDSYCLNSSEHQTWERGRAIQFQKGRSSTKCTYVFLQNKVHETQHNK